MLAEMQAESWSERHTGSMFGVLLPSQSAFADGIQASLLRHLALGPRKPTTQCASGTAHNAAKEFSL
jgi:hypothetical protein